MPLTIYRRHLATCKHYASLAAIHEARKCSCPIWVQGSLGGEYLRRSLDLVSWEAAQDRGRGWDASGEVGVIQPDGSEHSLAVLELSAGEATHRGLAVGAIVQIQNLSRGQWASAARAPARRAGVRVTGTDS